MRRAAHGPWKCTYADFTTDKCSRASYFDGGGCRDSDVHETATTDGSARQMLARRRGRRVGTFDPYPNARSSRSERRPASDKSFAVD